MNKTWKQIIYMCHLYTVDRDHAPPYTTLKKGVDRPLYYYLGIFCPYIVKWRHCRIINACTCILPLINECSEMKRLRESITLTSWCSELFMLIQWSIYLESLTVHEVSSISTYQHFHNCTNRAPFWVSVLKNAFWKDELQTQPCFSCVGMWFSIQHCIL
jgi:hypothetical protein